MLTASDLACVRGDRPLFSGISISLAGGEWLHVQGENGAGKTSLLRILAGLSPPAAGEVRWNDRPIRERAEDYRRQLIFLGHHGAVKEELSPWENLTFSAALDGLDLPDREVASALSRFGLAGREHLPVRFLSAGQKRRVLLARLAVRRAPLWILDEPFTALDVKAVHLLSNLIEAHLREGGMVILTSHQSLSLPHGKTLAL